MIFCGLINKNIFASVCPMPSKKCMWKHRETAECCYTSDKLTKEEFCSLVGIEQVPTDEELQQRQANLQNLLLKDEKNEDPTLDT